MDPATMIALAQLATQVGSQMFGGGDEKLQKVSNFDKNQKNFWNQYMNTLSGQGMQGGQMAMNRLQDFLNPESDIFKNFEAPFMQQFEQETIPKLAEQFAGMGGGALSSSGFGQALGGAGANLHTNLAYLKSNLMKDAISSMLNQFNTMSSTGLNTRPFQYIKNDQGGGPFGGFMSGLGNVESKTWKDLFSGFGQNKLAGASGQVTGQRPFKD